MNTDNCQMQWFPEANASPPRVPSLLNPPLYVGDSPWPYQPWTPWVYPEAPSQRIPDNCQIVTTSDTRSLWLGQNDARIAALEAEVKRLGQKCKRLKRKLAQRR